MKTSDEYSPIAHHVGQDAIIDSNREYQIFLHQRCFRFARRHKMLIAVVVAFICGILVTKLPAMKKKPRAVSDPLESNVTVTVDVTKSINSASGDRHGYACVSLDYWPETKCDYGRCSWKGSSILTLPLQPNGGTETDAHRGIRKAMESLSKIRTESSSYSYTSKAPAILRLGGSLSDLVRYNVTDTGPWNCSGFVLDDHQPVGYEEDPFRGPCLTMDQWDAVQTLCEGGACEIVFGLNALIGRTKSACPDDTICAVNKVENDRTQSCCYSYSGEWDPSNAKAFFEYIKAKRQKVWGFEYGNELAGFQGVQARLDVGTYVRGLCRLKNEIDAVWGGDGEDKPRIIAPDSGIEGNQAWFAEFLRKSSTASCSPDVVTWHQYLLGAGVDPAVSERSTNPDLLDSQRIHGDNIENIILSIDAKTPAPEIWMGETGGAYNSGRHGATDTFRSSFWYLDSMAILAAKGHQAFCRQTLVGGNYGLLDPTTFIPNPDFYALVLFQKLMGTKVLRVYDTSGINGRFLRSYAHCSRRADVDGSITFLLINLSGTTEFHVDIQGLATGNLDTLSYTSWVVSSKSLDSKNVWLNGGQLLQPSVVGDLPVMNGDHSEAPEEGRLSPRYTVKPHTYTFLRVDGAGASVCEKNSL